MYLYFNCFWQKKSKKRKGNLNSFSISIRKRQPESPSPDSISDQNMPFSQPFSDQASKIHTRFQTWPGQLHYVHLFHTIYIKLTKKEKYSYNR